MATISYSAPGRTGVVGNPSDIYGGSVISISIPERAKVTLTPHETMGVDIDEDSITVDRDTNLLQAIRGKWTDIGAAVLHFFAADISTGSGRPVRRLFDQADADEVRDTFFDRPFRLSAETTIPFRAGLSGSTALFGGLVGAVLEHTGVHLHHHHLAETLKYIEQNILKVACGYQDHYMIVFGGLSFMDFREKSGMQQTDQEPYATREDLSWTLEDSPFIIAHYGGVRAEKGIVHANIRQRWVAGEELAVRNNRRIGELGRLGKKALIDGRFEILAEIMNENHRLQQELGGSFDQIDDHIDSALRHGAKAAKLAGGGRGGTLIAMHEDPKYLAERLKEDGAKLVTFPAPFPGVQREE